VQRQPHVSREHVQYAGETDRSVELPDGLTRKGGKIESVRSCDRCLLNATSPSAGLLWNRPGRTWASPATFLSGNRRQACGRSDRTLHYLARGSLNGLHASVASSARHSRPPGQGYQDYSEDARTRGLRRLG